MNNVPVQNVIPGLIEPFPALALIITGLVGDQQPFACRTNASHGNDCCCDTCADPTAVQKLQVTAKNILITLFPLKLVLVSTAPERLVGSYHPLYGAWEP